MQPLLSDQSFSTLPQAKGVDCKIASGGGRMCVSMDRYEVCAMYVCV